MTNNKNMNYGKIEQIGSYRLPCKGMYELLQKYARAGIALYLEGNQAEPGQIAATCLREGVSYMMDFIPADKNDQLIAEIDFTKINPKDAPEEAQSEESHPHIVIWNCS